MGERVVSVDDVSKRALGGRALPVTIGPPSAEGSLRIARVADEDILARERAGTPLPILYFATSDLEHALRRLSRVEIDRALASRLANFSPRASDMALDWLFRRERRALVATAIAAESGPPLPEKALMDVFDASLARLGRLSGGLRFADVDAFTMAVTVLEGDAEILAEGTAADGASWTVPGMDETQSYIASGMALVAELGHPEYAEAPPYVPVQRVYWITPAQDELLDRFRHRHIAVRPWRGGLVAPWPSHALDELRERGCTFEPLFASNGDFMGALNGLTDAQVDRDLEEQLERVRARPDADAKDRWNGLRVRQALLRRALVETLRRESPALAGPVEREVEHETHALRRALARDPSWLAPPPERGGAALAEVHRALAALAGDAPFFAARYDIEGLTDLRDELRAAATSIDACIARLRSP